MAKPVPCWISATAWAVFLMFRREAVANTATWDVQGTQGAPEGPQTQDGLVIPSGLSALPPHSRPDRP